MGRLSNSLSLFWGLIIVFNLIQSDDSREVSTEGYKKAAFELIPVVSELLQTDLNSTDFRNMLENSKYCDACRLITEDINTQRSILQFNRTGDDPLFQRACLILETDNIISKRECIGLVDVYGDFVRYVTNNVEDAREICPILLQQFQCTDLQKADYSITISTDVVKPKRESANQDGELPALRVLQITDVHFDPSYRAGSNGNCMETMCCMNISGEPQTVEDAAGYWTDYRECDIPDYFINDTFAHIAKTHEYDYVYFTGDIIGHQLWATTREANLQDMSNFWQLFKQHFTDQKVFPLLGNHEAHPCNIYPPPVMNAGKFSVQWLFDATAEFWKTWLPNEALETVKKGGYYSISPEDGFRIIAINSNIAYNLNFGIIMDDKDPYGQLQWLADELHKAEDNNEVVHLLSHIPGGADMVNSWAQKLRQIIRRYRNIIAAIFNGHTHFDELNLYYSTDNQPITVAYNGGSLTPYSNVNPNYKLYSVDPTNYDVLNYDMFMMNLTEANANGMQSPNWYKGYSFKEEYNLNDTTPQTIHDFVIRLATEPKLRDLYYNNSVRYATPSLQAGCDNDCQKGLVCRIVNTVNSDTKQCDSLQTIMIYEV